jgi:hypothetical protein
MKREMKQTAVEWQHIELSKFLYGKSEFTDANDILIKAKDMEKEQIIEFSKVVLKEYKRIRPEEISTIKRLYNETFNTNDK